MEYYDAIASGYDELHKEEQLKKYRFIEEHFDIEKDDMLLDVGCGTGLSAEIFRCSVTGVEPSKEMLKKAEKIAENTDYVQGRAELLPFKDKAFDVVICVTAIHNFEEPRMALKEMKRVGIGKGAITVLKKARKAEELRALVEEMFDVEKVVEEDKDFILFLDIG